MLQYRERETNASQVGHWCSWSKITSCIVMSWFHLDVSDYLFNPSVGSNCLWTIMIPLLYFLCLSHLFTLLYLFTVYLTITHVVLQLTATSLHSLSSSSDSWSFVLSVQLCTHWPPPPPPPPSSCAAHSENPNSILALLYMYHVINLFNGSL